MVKESNRHQFSFYYPLLSLSSEVSSCTISDETLVHRLVTVMRYQVNDECILFNDKGYRYATFRGSAKKKIEMCLGQVFFSVALQPELVLLLPLLKKESLEQAVYNAVVAGISAIQLIITEKCHRRSITDNEFQRLQKIIIAACEQAKYYTIPLLHKVSSLEQAVTTYKNYTFYYADPEGDALKKLDTNSVIMVGPEGDLTYEEKEYLKANNTHFFRLTPTILRSQEAVLVAVSYARIV